MTEVKSLNFIEEIIEADLVAGKHSGKVLTRFPPEPNGYLHVGHAKSICLNFGLAQQYRGLTNLRFDDTNPDTEDVEYVESIKADIRWLGFDWEDREFYASDYFGQLYEWARQLIKTGKAYVDDSTSEQMAAMKGTPTQAGTESPYRNREVEENLLLFTKMKDGAFAEGAKVLRAKIDMASPNMLLRDPVMYRIKYAHHHRTGDGWCIYPMYDFAHGQSDSLEGITHSICTLEFENHRPLYNWYIEQLGIFPSRQIEFARLNLSFTVTSKRKLLLLVNEGHVSGWDDPRMPTISGMRRRGYTADAIRTFCDKVGIAKRENTIELNLLEFCVREDLNKKALRVMAVIDAVLLTITNYPEDGLEWLKAENNPEDPEGGSHEMPFSRQIYIEREDFMVDPPKGYFRLTPGGMVRLKGAYIIKCEDYKLNESGQVSEILAVYVPESKSGQDTSGLKVKSTIHWVEKSHAVAAEARLYDRLFSVEDPTGDEDQDFRTFINPDSLQTVNPVFIEPWITEARPSAGFQFLRKGYFSLDADSKADKLIFNRTVTLKDDWSKKNVKE